MPGEIARQLVVAVIRIRVPQGSQSLNGSGIAASLKVRAEGTARQPSG
jgi:hypothetical protein